MIKNIIASYIAALIIDDDAYTCQNCKSIGLFRVNQVKCIFEFKPFIIDFEVFCIHCGVPTVLPINAYFVLAIIGKNKEVC